MKSLGVLAYLVAIALAVPQPVHDEAVELDANAFQKRAQTLCGPQDYVDTFLFTIKNDISDPALEGAQCITVVGLFNSVVSWSTSWSWSDSPTTRKSFPRAERIRFRRSSLWDYHSLTTSWKWSYTGSDVKATVAYEITGSGAGSTTISPSCLSSPDWSVQVWLGKFGNVIPASSTGSLIAAATIDGVDFDIFKGTRPGLTAYTFVATADETDFTGDLLKFVKWLVENDGHTNHICIHSVSGGTEIFEGTNATFNTASYYVEQYIRPIGEPVPTTTTTTQPPPTQTGTCVPKWGQCGGIGYTGPTCCQTGSTCTWYNDWDSLCL